MAVLKLVIASVAVSLLWAPVSTVAADRDWTATQARIESLRKRDNLEDADRAALIKLRDEMSAVLQTPGDIGVSALDAAIAIADAVSEKIVDDPTALLEELRGRIDTRPDSSGLRERLAEAYLKDDLPWTSLELLGPPTTLDAFGDKILKQTRLALDIIRSDAREAAQLDYAPPSSTSIEQRLYDLMGIPPLDYAGSYADFTEKTRVRIPTEGAIGSSTGSSDRRDYQGPPLMSIVMKAARQARIDPSLQPRLAPASELDLGSTRLTRLRDIVAKVGTRAEEIDVEVAKADGEFLSALVAANFGVGHRAPPLMVKDARRLHDGAVFRLQPLSSGEVGDTPGKALVAFGFSSGHPRLFAFDIYATSSLRSFDRGGRDTQQLVFSTSRFGSDSTLSVFVFDTAAGKLWQLGSGLFHGSFNIVSFGKLEAPIVTLDESTNDRRFQDCNQCPARRRLWIVAYDESAKGYVTIAARRTGADYRTRTNANLFGLSPEMMEETFDLSGLLSRLAGRGRAYLDKGFAEDVEKLLGHIENVLFEEHEFADAAALSERIVERLEVEHGDPRVAKALAKALSMRLISLFLNSDIDGAMAMTRDPSVNADVGKDEEARLDFVSTAATIAMQAGDYDATLKDLDFWRAQNRSYSSEGTFARYALAVGDFPLARTAALEATHMAYRAGYPGNAAIDMVVSAQASARGGDDSRALDWLSKAFRLTRSARDAQVDSVGYEIAADIALRRSAPGLALQLLDQAIVLTSDASWLSDGGSILTEYARAYEVLGEGDLAERMYAAAAAVSSRERGATYITAQSLRAGFAERKGDLVGALALASDAFAAVLSGRSRIGVEQYKLSFIATSANVAAQNLRLLLATHAAPEKVFDALDSWRLQVFQDLHQAKSVAVVAGADVASRLKEALRDGEVYVAFDTTATSPIAIAVRREGLAVTQLSVSRETLQRQLATMARWLDPAETTSAAFMQRRFTPPELRGVLRSLYDELIVPLALGPNVKHLVVSPDEALGAVPWSALLAPEDSYLDTIRRWAGFSTLHPLAQDMATSVALSARLLLSASPIESFSSSGTVGLVGAFSAVDPSRWFVGTPSALAKYASPRPLPALQHGLEEILAIRKSFPASKADLLLDSESLRSVEKASLNRDGTSVDRATREAVLALAHRVDVLHISGHAVFDGAKPMQSKIFLDPDGATGANDRALTAEDLMDLELSHNRLIVLSACETGRGQIAAGDEVFGFLRGLMGAGAHSEVLTRWSVDDAATATLFASFYKQIASGVEPAEALRVAESATFDAYQHPFYWAAPTLYGWGR